MVHETKSLKQLKSMLQDIINFKPTMTQKGFEDIVNQDILDLQTRINNYKEQ